MLSASVFPFLLINKKSRKKDMPMPATKSIFLVYKSCDKTIEFAWTWKKGIAERKNRIVKPSKNCMTDPGRTKQ